MSQSFDLDEISPEEVSKGFQNVCKCLIFQRYKPTIFLSHLSQFVASKSFFS